MAASVQSGLGESVGTGECHGSFGEILQGALPGSKKFLVNLKIKNASRVTVRLASCRYSEEKEQDFACAYARLPKSHKIVRNILSDLGRHDDFALEVERDIPVGKGLSSSTADMVASIHGLETALSVAMKPDYISRSLVEIEPSDPLHYSGTAAFHHTTGELIFQSDYIPPLRVLGIDLGGVVDTVEFNDRTIEWSDAELQRYAALLDEVEQALSAGDVPWLARIATISAELWQKISPKEAFDRALALVRETGGLGLINTHSGSVIGLMYEPACDVQGAALRAVTAAFAGCECRWYETVTCPG
jgi:L-threonine kinase